MTIEVTTHELVVQHDRQEVKRVGLKGLASQATLPFADWVAQLTVAAQDRRTTHPRRRQMALPISAAPSLNQRANGRPQPGGEGQGCARRAPCALS